MIGRAFDNVSGLLLATGRICLSAPQVALDFVGLTVLIHGDHKSFNCCVSHKEGLIFVC